MKNKILLTLFAFCLLASANILAQRAKIVTEAVTPHRLGTLGLETNSVSSGLNIVPNETFVYFSAKNIGNTEPINTAVFELTSKPTGSTASLEIGENNWVQFKTDLIGRYDLKLTITTASGTHDTTTTIYSATFVGVGNFAGISTQYPNCMTCHQNHPNFVEIYNRWSESGHANIFNRQITAGSAGYSTSCVKCHTTGYDHNLTANNNGFDDVAAQLGWNWDDYKPPKADNWELLRSNYSGLVNFATIGCEMCHGPGGEHVKGGSKEKIQITLESGTCAQCHDEPWRHNKYEQWANSVHSEAIWSNSFAQGASSQNNSLANCIRCHDGRGFVNFTKGLTTNTTGMVSASQQMIGCATCHDPHGNSNEYALRSTPAGSDTLANGFKYTGIGGKGELCMNCHKARRDNAVYAASTVSSSHWGPHNSVQADVFLGQNAAEFGSSYLSSPHLYAIEGGCVGCHMVATTDTGTVNRDKVGGHSFSLHNEETGYYHTADCVRCHGGKSSWEDFKAKGDFDGNGVVESIPKEIDGLLKNLRMAMPPIGVDSISWQGLRDLNDPNFNKAYYNYQLIAYEGSKGMHNAMFSIDVLQKTTKAIGGFVSDVNAEDIELPGSYILSQNFPNPFNPTTEISFTIPKAGNVKLTVYDIIGKEIAVLINDNLSAGTHKVKWNAASLPSGVYLYRLETANFIAVKKMVLLK
jgi:hypothetical protein